MYTLVECFVITGIALFLGAGLFISMALVVLLMAGVRVVATTSRRLVSRARPELRDKLVASPLHQAVALESLKMR
jgi:hypothetical protein